jgi:hypothetical protein
MTMECYRVHIPVGTKVPGRNASGNSTYVLSGEYLVHRLAPKLVDGTSPVLRFVGADPTGRDVHVTLEALRTFPSSQGVRTMLVEDDPEIREAA